jgi:ABC-type branched-subunit amino acid transport system substrate-binding protein
MAARRRLFAAAWALLMLAGCAAQAAVPVRIALLAPFEGRYREVGYNALYAVRLALLDADTPAVELLAVDDGGSAASAADRARALALDPHTRVVIALGCAAAAAATQGAFGDLPVVVAGHWSGPVQPGVFVLASAALDSALTTPACPSVTEAARLPTPLVGGEVFALAQFPRLRADLNGIVIASSAALPDAAFAARYRASDTFAPPPGLLASLTYDAARVAAQVAAAAPDRAAVLRALQNIRHDGVNGTIRFSDGWWAGAPIHRYRYDAQGALTPVEGVVE